MKRKEGMGKSAGSSRVGETNLHTVFGVLRAPVERDFHCLGSIVFGEGPSMGSTVLPGSRFVIYKGLP